MAETIKDVGYIKHFVYFVSVFLNKYVHEEPDLYITDDCISP